MKNGQIELEKTYLVKYLPESFHSFKSKEIIDIYIPAESDHPKLRLRKNGEKYELTKKEPVKEGDASSQIEQTIVLNQAEFAALQQVPGKTVHKIRYYYEVNGRVGEIDVFQDELYGLVLADFEFNSVEEKDTFEMPEFCLSDVTQEKFIAGGILCGKKYEDLADNLELFGYKRIA